jgi:peptide methionine sulfoxide reductase msrA/msrB
MNKYASLTPDILHILEDKGTEAPFSYGYDTDATQGTYLCRGCGQALFRADSHFSSGCGWPSFDDEISNTVKRVSDADGRRTEILCANCNGHLGHVFGGEQFTAKNTRHCVNSLAIEFVENTTVLKTEETILAAGCFWGVEYFLQKLPGVLKTEVGYIGGIVDNPTYEQVCTKKTGHLEAIRVVFDPTVLTYENLLKYFFEIHDPSQDDGQGPDLGSQYLSAIFYFDKQQKSIAEQVINELKESGYSVVTSLYEVSSFWPAEGYHQDHYAKTGKAPYCHIWTKKFP